MFFIKKNGFLFKKKPLKKTGTSLLDSTTHCNSLNVERNFLLRKTVKCGFAKMTIENNTDTN